MQVCDEEYVKRTALYLLPACLIMLAFTAYPRFLPSDWLYHVNYPHPASDNYPQLAPFITSFFWNEGMIGIWCILLFIVFPFLLLQWIAKNDAIPLAYLYLSGIPWVLCWGGFFAQAIEHIWILLNLISPWFWLPTLLLGFETHREHIGAWALSIFVAFIRMKIRIPKVNIPYGPEH
jgi:hypothetical protein